MGPDLAIGPQIQPDGSQQKGNIWPGGPPSRPPPPTRGSTSALPTRGSTSARPSPPVSSPYTCPGCWHSLLAGGQDPPLLSTRLRPARGCSVSPRSPQSRSPRGPTTGGTWPPGRLRSRPCSPVRRMGWGWVHPEVHRIRMPALPSPAGCPWGSYFFFLGISFLICEKGMIIVTSPASWLEGPGRRAAGPRAHPHPPHSQSFPLPCPAHALRHTPQTPPWPAQSSALR